jgi:hypothetical protein
MNIYRSSPNSVSNRVSEDKSDFIRQDFIPLTTHRLGDLYWLLTAADR